MCRVKLKGNLKSKQIVKTNEKVVDENRSQSEEKTKNFEKFRHEVIERTEHH